MAKIAFYIFILMVAFLPSAHANEGEAYVYSPEGCDFTATFPFEPGFVRRCPSDKNLPCLEVAQFTDRTDFDQTINVEMICQPIAQEVYKTYTKDNMEAVILNMTRDANLPELPEVTYQEEENGLKIAGTSGIKTTGFSTKIFVTQIWVTENSVMSVEGEMSLDHGDEGDKKFADILQSIGPKDQTNEEEEEEEEEAVAEDAN